MVDILHSKEINETLNETQTTLKGIQELVRRFTPIADDIKELVTRAKEQGITITITINKGD